ncbi:NAD(P)H-hydrate epimerase [Chryseobacterium defluvii]|uniref:Bifunctional NAD(P)H-hydrate repair enzyme n=1 Tax=Chryseobacterium defluvii TaxID=160396 RepID=A0A840K7D1_9FLAO|nr:NAD(P)H-hydrate dehydratase [Chryseobacterium defluvii]MBB4805139.1 NAD(P)H-hydrate epimerase [Chryseobacterium defluvii]
MKIFTAEQIRECDRYTIHNEPVSSIQLMEKAAQACSDWISENCKNHRKVIVFCGSGNNGGDGLAIGRILYLKGFNVDVFVNALNQKFSDDASVNFKRLKDFSGIDVKTFQEIDQYHFDHKTIIIDALFGTGLSRNLEGEYKMLIDKLNEKENTKISIDIPSGLFADVITGTDSTVFKADYTLSFQFWKKSFLHPETGKHTGKVIILDIDLSKEYISDTKTSDFVIDDTLVENIFKPKQEFSHKGTYGRVTIVGGSYGKIGAEVLATKSALRTGAGLTFTLAPKCGYEILQTSCPEAMFKEGGTEYIEKFDIEENSVCGIGSGLGTHTDTAEAFLRFLKQYSKPMVLDADALNIISRDNKNIKLVPEKSIITPHPKEFERLFGSTADSFERVELARRKAVEYKIYIVLKDHHTQIITPEGKVYYNITGNAGLAKGGSGDILTGVLASLLAQGYTEEETAVFGVWFHGRAADFAAANYSKEAMLPTDVINEFGNIFEEINKKATNKL